MQLARPVGRWSQAALDLFLYGQFSIFGQFSTSSTSAPRIFTRRPSGNERNAHDSVKSLFGWRLKLLQPLSDPVGHPDGRFHELQVNFQVAFVF